MGTNLEENEVMVSLTKYNALMKVLEQVMWERDIAISQLKEHRLAFGGLMSPLTLEEIQAIPDDIPIYMEERRSKRLSPLWGWYAKEYCKDIDSNYYTRLDYGRTYRYWYGCKPTDEERFKAKWDDRTDKEKCRDI